jgi:cytochrome b
MKHADETLLVWDRLVRTVHWLVAAVVLVNLTVLEDGGHWHRWAGYAACVLIAVRTIWGFIGSKHARFSDWFPWPSKVTRYIRALRDGHPPRMLGHNPLGALMMLSLWVLILSLGVTGFMMGTDRFFGDEWLETVHEAIANVLIGAVGLHVLAAVVESRRHKENLVLSMMTGRKPAQHDRDTP